jgi:hypothetical protein
MDCPNEKTLKMACSNENTQLIVSDYVPTTDRPLVERENER